MLVPVGNIVVGGSGATRTVTVTPAANQAGTATITLTVGDGALTASDTFVLTVTAVNDAPTISDVANQTIFQNTATAALSFTVGDVETAAGSLTVMRTSSNLTLVPVSNIVFGGSGATRTVTVTPAAGQTGTATITVTVSDGALTASDTWLLTVAATPTYLLSEGFEGTGFENSGWRKNGAANPDYVANVLGGLQSLNTIGNQRIRRDFDYGSSFFMYFQVRWNTWSPDTTVLHWSTTPSSGGEVGIYATGNRLQLYDGVARATGTTAIAANTTYHVWVEWTKGTGTNGTMKLFMSTSGVKPATPEASITNGTGGATNEIHVGSDSTGPNIVYDRLLVDDVEIGSNP
jgi:hypothetical protein